jgi:hypothetical protein
LTVSVTSGLSVTLFAKKPPIEPEDAVCSVRLALGASSVPVKDPARETGVVPT